MTTANQPPTADKPKRRIGRLGRILIGIGAGFFACIAVGIATSTTQPVQADEPTKTPVAPNALTQQLKDDWRVSYTGSGGPHEAVTDMQARDDGDLVIKTNLPHERASLDAARQICESATGRMGYLWAQPRGKTAAEAWIKVHSAKGEELVAKIYGKTTCQNMVG